MLVIAVCTDNSKAVAWKELSEINMNCEARVSSYEIQEFITVQLRVDQARHVPTSAGTACTVAWIERISGIKRKSSGVETLVCSDGKPANSNATPSPLTLVASLISQ